MTTRILAALCGLAFSSGLSVAMADGPGACGDAPTGGCCQGCRQPCQKVCVPVPDIKKTTKVVYGCRCIDFCIPHNKECHACNACCDQGCCGEHGDCCPGVCPGCERPRVRKALIKWVRTTECPTFKCEVREAPCEDCCSPPACGGGCEGTGVMEGEAPPPPDMEPTPGDAPPKKTPVPPSAAKRRRGVATR